MTSSHHRHAPNAGRRRRDPDVVEKLKKGYKSGNKTFKVHIDGYNLLPFFKGEVKENPRQGFLYWSDDGDLMALRVGNWKCVFMEQRGHGLKVWQEPLVPLRVPDIYNLRSDPFERATEDADMFYSKWKADRAFLLVPAQAIVGEFLKTFKDFPPRQRPASFSIDQALEKAQQQQSAIATSGGGRREVVWNISCEGTDSHTGPEPGSGVRVLHPASVSPAGREPRSRPRRVA